MYCGRCSSHSTRYPIPPRLICSFARPMRTNAKIPSSGSWVKSSKSKGQFCRLLAAAVHYRKLALLGLGSVGSYPPGQSVRKKKMLRFTKRIITLRKKWVKLSHSPFPTIRQSQSAPLTSHLAIFAGRPRQDSNPFCHDGQNDL